MSDTVSIVVIDDHALFRSGVVSCVDAQPDLQVVGEGATGTDALRKVKELEPDIALLDISMPGNGIDAAAAIRDAGCRTRVVMLTVSEEDDDIVSALEAGAVGYLLKGIGASELVEALRRIAKGETFVSPNLAAKVFAGMNTRSRPNALSVLSSQEIKVLKLVSQGLSNREVALQLGILEKTVKFHMSRLLRKLNVRNRVEATNVARREWQ
ncbi:response regulator transcription factor [Aliihoeflea sp. 40Bstr573]|uniref:response regulator n=1 Tax=Aliihoeflea sp. 40Bstr573 TaxID=2696467 RepID=UPI00209428FB|nr:response regulator transcription factor [Aliihoeflea sp. 40Bstr573]MCO6388773.1 response regulator [Aliihoeflea sp. 40Bstr573]